MTKLSKNCLDDHHKDLESNNDYETTDADTTTASPSTFTTTTEKETQSTGQCEKYPDTLVGRVIPNTTLEIEWDQIHEEIG